MTKGHSFPVTKNLKLGKIAMTPCIYEYANITS